MDKKKYGKSIGDIVKIKSDFFNHNEDMLRLSAHQADALLLQKKREKCKICEKPISGEPLYHSQRMDYYLCPVCGHLNSAYEDTEDFAERVYLSDNYENNYSEEDRMRYRQRMESIYLPKASFLIGKLEEDGLEKGEISILDDGAGSGYFVSALKHLGIKARGIEISGPQVEFANRMAGESILEQVDSGRIPQIIRETGVNTVTLIGVLEHVIDLHSLLTAIKDNTAIRYIFLSVPLFSFSCIFEASHQHCYNRHAGGTHTHLFSDSSLKYMAEGIGFEETASWKFGSDMMDLYRMISVSLDQSGNPKLREYFEGKFLPILDELQLVVDKSEFASETHLLLRRKA
ncbi:MAG: methyltransferase domain-containing protein [Lachnospiraceae bacterium]|nr:methyltransferase domain-containing protein [Lachnospiraceae bacterium]